MVALLAAGLEAQGFVETACGYGQGFRRFGKFGRAGMQGEAYYVQPDGTLWFSALHITEPDLKVEGPILEQIFEAGCRAIRPAEGRRISRPLLNPDAALDELMDSRPMAGVQAKETK